MNKLIWLPLLLFLGLGVSAQTPENLVVDGLPPVSPELKADAGRYLEFRAASFGGWHPVKRELLINTRLADTTQLHEVRSPGGARRQLTFTANPCAAGAGNASTDASSCSARMSVEVSFSNSTGWTRTPDGSRC